MYLWVESHEKKFWNIKNKFMDFGLSGNYTFPIFGAVCGHPAWNGRVDRSSESGGEQRILRCELPVYSFFIWKLSCTWLKSYKSWMLISRTGIIMIFYLVNITGMPLLMLGLLTAMFAEKLSLVCQSSFWPLTGYHELCWRRCYLPWAELRSL